MNACENRRAINLQINAKISNKFCLVYDNSSETSFSSL